MEDPTYHLEGIIKTKEEMQDFEGPLSLILLLLSKNKIEIRDIKISEILDQYLAYLQQMESMTGSSFKNPNGLDEKGHYSTAGDMAKLTQYCMQNQAFRSIVSQKSADIGGRILVNHNKLLWSLKGCIGVKTGYTMACGRLLVSCCERDGTRLVCVTLSDPNDWTDHTALYEWAFRNYGYKKVISRNMTLSLPVVSGTETAVTVSPDRDIRLFLPADADICYRVDLPRFVFGGIEKGEDAGELAVLSGDRELASAKLIYDMTVLTERTVKVGAWNALTKLW